MASKTELARQPANSQSLADMHQIYSQYLQRAFQQYREQNEKVVQRGEALAQRGCSGASLMHQAPQGLCGRVVLVVQRFGVIAGALCKRPNLC